MIRENSYRASRTEGSDLFLETLHRRFEHQVFETYDKLHSYLLKSGMVCPGSVFEHFGLVLDHRNTLSKILLHPGALLWLHLAEALFIRKKPIQSDHFDPEPYFLNILIPACLKIKYNLDLICVVPPLITLYPTMIQIEPSDPDEKYTITLSHEKGISLLRMNFGRKYGNRIECLEGIIIEGAISRLIRPVQIGHLTVEHGGKTLLSGYYNQDFPHLDESTWKARLKRSLNLIAYVWPEMLDEMAQFVRVIVPASFTTSEVHISGSDHQTIGTIFTSLADEPQLSDGLIHEYRHNLLHCIMKTEPLFRDNCEKPALYFSPWRPDPRPAHGIFHAIFVFCSVSEYYLRIIRLKLPEFDPEEMRFRLALESTRTLIAIRELNAQSELNEAGQALLNALHQYIKTIYQQQETSLSTIKKVHSCISSELAAWTRQWNLKPQGNVEKFLSDFLDQKLAL